MPMPIPHCSICHRRDCVCVDVTCPRCAGFANAFTRHPDVNGGRCLLCNGALVVSAVLAESVLRADATEAAKQPGKVIDLPGFGPVRIERDVAGNAGPLRSFVAHVASDVGELPAWFTITDRRIVVELVCDGLRRRRNELNGALQAALR